MKVIGSAAKTVFYLKKIQGQYPTWRLNYKIKCKSTENELTKLLRDSEIKKNQPLAMIAREQFSGVGQNSKTWVSPKGGIWLSAAYPIFSKKFACQIFNLSLGIKLCEMLRQENINVCLKWPNDIFFWFKKVDWIFTKGDNKRQRNYLCKSGTWHECFKLHSIRRYFIIKSTSN